MNMRIKSPLALLAFLSLFSGISMAPSQTDNPEPPDEVVNLIFIHHSTGENWLTDGYGNLGRTLGKNNYFVSDTNYGWGPEAIGDRTDIPNWTEWFRSENTPAYMEALFDEHGQNSNYERWLEDPGGENRIVIFKSCFPNSALEGRPDDPPGNYEELSVAGAKYVYNQILQYFATRPDKLFIVVTAPPLSDPTYSENARAFNEWLVNDWLRENDYSLPNVGVFDFYNVLTAENAHHRMRQGSIEHIIGPRNTLYYPSEDDHPSIQGSQKATEEFVPLLNAYYNRWESGGFADLDTGQPLSPSVSDRPSESITGLVDDFESGPFAGTEYWNGFWDESTATTIDCSVQASDVNSGSGALRLDFGIAANSWATCALFYEAPQDWSTGQGITFYYHASQPGLVYDIDLYRGDPTARETYLFTIEAVPESSEKWIPMDLHWSDFHRADWEANPGAEFTEPDQIIGMAFGFNTFPDASNDGSLWIDDINLAGITAEAEAEPQTQAPEGVKPARRLTLPCLGSLLAPFGMLGLGFWMHGSHQRSRKGCM